MESFPTLDKMKKKYFKNIASPMGREDEMALIYLRINTINNKKREIQHVESNMCVIT